MGTPVYRVLFRDLSDPTNSSDAFVIADSPDDLRAKMRAAELFQGDAYHDDVPLEEWSDPKHESFINTWADSIVADLMARGISDTSDDQTIWVLVVVIEGSPS